MLHIQKHIFTFTRVYTRVLMKIKNKTNDTFL